MNVLAERLANISLSEQKPLPDIAHFPFIKDCFNMLESDDLFSVDDKMRFMRNLTILTNTKHENTNRHKTCEISGEDKLKNFWSFSIRNKDYRNGLTLDFRFNDIDRELVFEADGTNTMHNIPIEEGVWAWDEKVDDLTAKKWLGKALEVTMHTKEVASRVRYGKARYEQHEFTRFRR